MRPSASDLGQHLVKVDRRGFPGSPRTNFDLIAPPHQNAYYNIVNLGLVEYKTYPEFHESERVKGSVKKCFTNITIIFLD